MHTTSTRWIVIRYAIHSKIRQRVLCESWYPPWVYREERHCQRQERRQLN
jgi:histidyl-tRNA synthetase